MYIICYTSFNAGRIKNCVCVFLSSSDRERKTKGHLKPESARRGLIRNEDSKNRSYSKTQRSSTINLGEEDQDKPGIKENEEKGKNRRGVTMEKMTSLTHDRRDRKKEGLISDVYLRCQ